MQDDSKAKVYLANAIPPGSMVYPPIPNFNNEKVINVKGFVDLGVGADYKINPKFAAFIKINNLLNTNYSKYLYYRVNGLNAFGGITYSF